MSIDQRVSKSKAERLREIVNNSGITLRQPTSAEVRKSIGDGMYKTWYGKSRHEDGHVFLYPTYLWWKRLRNN